MCPQNATGVDKNWTVTVSGATVRAPYYVHGQTRLADWLATLRAAPAPWAELQTDNFVLTLPSAAVRGLGDPAQLMAFWRAVVDAEADLAAIPRARPRRERIVLDADISGGWMHSGYPVSWRATPPEPVTVPAASGQIRVAGSGPSQVSQAAPCHAPPTQVMAYPEVAGDLVSTSRLTKGGDWGVFHGEGAGVGEAPMRYLRLHPALHRALYHVL